MDPGALLRTARATARLDQRALARRAGVSRNALGSYERGQRSPTVAVLDHLLATCGLALAATLEPATASFEAEVEQVDAAEVSDAGEVLVRFADEFAALGVTWAVDSATALGLHGIAVGDAWPSVAVVLDDALRLWFFRAQVWAATLDGDDDRVRMEDDAAEVRARFDLGLARCMHMPCFHVRVVDDVEGAVPVAVTSSQGSRTVPVLPLLDVLESRPQWARVVAAVLERRAARARLAAPRQGSSL